MTGNSVNTGEYMCVAALTDTTILGSTVGNIDNISGAVVPQGSVLLGEWSVLHVSGDCVLYKL